MTGARRLVLVLLAGAAIAAIVPAIIARSHRLQVMRADLAEVVGECRARYVGARTGADTVAADAWQPPLHGERRPRDPACGAYRRRNMLGAGA